MYVLIYKSQVIDGPKKWNFRSLEKTLQEELNITYRLPVNFTEAIIINNNTKILPATFIYQEYNSKIQKPVDGPWWDFSSGIAVGSYTIGYKRVDEVKSELKDKLKQIRYEKEIAGTTIIIDNKELKISTSRDARNVYLQKYSILDDDATINWKFDDCFINISKEQLKSILVAIDHHVQAVFDWENTMTAAIDSCNTVFELDAIVLEEPNTDSTLADQLLQRR